MMKANTAICDVFNAYSTRLQAVLASADWTPVSHLVNEMARCWREGRQVFFCGNGGSAGNAIHLANDFIYGIAKQTGGGMRVQSLSANAAVITCLANDVGYDRIYSEQLAVQACDGDLLVVLSGSGNSPNILRSLEKAREMGMTSCAILGYGGGAAKALCDIPIHFPVDDMQIAEDLQLVVGHMVMQYLFQERATIR
ncbi:phosphoheptose isomerase [Herbaspirillum sp. GW103]|jgi:D-sedoheptulose 7-phosphate isomerase|nr:phosphoheptose isomerase [Herbaspirillum sp. GW103]